MLENSFTLPNGLVVPNRLIKASTTEALADARADVSDGLVALYERWGRSGVGLILSGNVGIDPEHLVRPGDVCVTKDTDVAGLRRLATAMKREGARAVLQICHAGRQTQRWLNPHPIAPSRGQAVKVLKGFGTPREATREEIAQVREGFVVAALKGEEAGFDGCQLHAAHGYLLNQFLSPACNQRSDEYGGSLENRARLLLEIVREVKARRRSSAFAVTVKLNSADFQKGGFTEEDSLRVVRLLDAEGIDLLEISGGNYEAPAQFGSELTSRAEAPAERDDRSGRSPRRRERTGRHGVRESTVRREAYFLEFTQKAREVTQVPLLVTGGFRGRPAMEAALKSGATDFVGLARPFCVEPELGHRLLSSDDARIELRTKWPGGALASFLEMAWYSEHIQRMGRGRAPDAGASPLWAGVKHYLRDRRAAFFGRRRHPSRGLTAGARASGVVTA